MQSFVSSLRRDFTGTTDIGLDNISVTNPNACITPTITPGSNPQVCFTGSSQNANLTYSATTGTPTQYNIVWDAGALSAGFANVTLATLPSSPIVISVPPASAGIYAGNP